MRGLLGAGDRWNDQDGYDSRGHDKYNAYQTDAGYSSTPGAATISTTPTMRGHDQYNAYQTEAGYSSKPGITSGERNVWGGGGHDDYNQNTYATRSHNGSGVPYQGQRHQNGSGSFQSASGMGRSHDLNGRSTNPSYGNFVDDDRNRMYSNDFNGRTTSPSDGGYRREYDDDYRHSGDFAGSRDYGSDSQYSRRY
jgi:hypothetical protein